MTFDRFIDYIAIVSMSSVIALGWFSLGVLAGEHGACVLW